MNCAICNREAPANFDDLVNEGWIPSFFASQQQIEGPFVPNASISIGGCATMVNGKARVPSKLAHRYN